MFLLDTNIISELRRSERAAPAVVAWVRRIPPAELFLSAISLLEVRLGALLAARKDAAKGAMLETWIERQVLPAFHGRIVAVDATVAERCAELHVPDPRPERDSLIAASALVHRLTLVTRNIRDFAPMGVALCNPWDDASRH